MRYAFFVLESTMQNDLLRQELTVSELTRLIKTTLEEGFYGLRITGEISNFRPSSSGHWFFALKDRDSVINAVMFKGKIWRVPFIPRDGDKVTVTGAIDVYEKRGTYQIVCETMRKSGSGDILALLEERKKKYESLGYYDRALKKPIPRYPKKVGVVTSRTGAALQDILQILGRRAPALDVVVLNAVVQGEEAGEAIAKEIELASMLNLCDVLIVGRGGGSLEDLLPFSEERVIEAIHRCSIPLVSAVGHEIDWALSDYVADMRAPTPSAAAEMVSQGYMDLRKSLEELSATLTSLIETRLANAENSLSFFRGEKLAQALRNKVENLEFRLANASEFLEKELFIMMTKREHDLSLAKGKLLSFRPSALLEKEGEALRGAGNLIAQAWASRLLFIESTVKGASERLKALDPLAILGRGFSIVTDREGKILSRASALRKGMDIDVRFSDGKRSAVVKE